MNDPRCVYADDELEVLQTVVGPLANNVYVLRSPAGGPAVLVDAAAEGPALLDWALKLGVTAVWTTHGHHDHIGAVSEFLSAGVDVRIALDDAHAVPEAVRSLQPGDKFSVGAVPMEVLATPGHTPGSLCFHPQDKSLVFTGDTLFPGGPGATHFPGGDFDTIIESLRTKLFELPDETLVLPGHGDYTTIGNERPHLDEWIARGW